MKRPTVAQNIALSITVLVAILLLLILFGVHLQLPVASEQKQAKSLTMADIEELPEPPLEEEMFVEPEIADLGDPENTQAEPDALTPQGEPEPAPVPNDQLVVNGPNPNPNPEAEPKISTTKPSPVQTTTPSKKDKPDQKIQAPAEEKPKVSFHNGKRDGKGDTASSGKGDNPTGSARGEAQGGRKLLNNPTVTGFNISNTITVQVTVQVKADGSVVPGSAKVVSGLNSKFADLKQKLITASSQTRWTPKKGAPTVQGTITWTLKPGTK